MCVTLHAGCVRSMVEGGGEEVLKAQNSRTQGRSAVEPGTACLCQAGGRGEGVRVRAGKGLENTSAPCCGGTGVHDS